MNDEIFRYFMYHYNVTKARKLILLAKKQVICLDLNPRKLLRETFTHKIDIHKIVDMTTPIIMARHHDIYLPIDGWEQIRQASIRKVKTLPAYLLTKKESLDILEDH